MQGLEPLVRSENQGNVPSITDDELVTRTAAGDDDAFRELVERWERPVLAFLARMLRSPEDARDLASECFLRVYRHAGTYRPEGKFKSWLFRIAGNLARSELRRRSVLQWVGLDSAPEPASPRAAPDEQLADRERAELLRGAIEALPPRQRQAIVLRHDIGMAYREIAETMNTSVSAVETLLYRGMTALKRRLGHRR